MSEHPIVAALKRPQALQRLSSREWEWLIGHARAAQLLARLAVAIERANCFDEIPPGPRRHLDWARRQWLAQRRTLPWDVDIIGSALAGIDTPIVLLKGTAYQMAGLPPAAGRTYTDIDIMVRRDRLDAVEAALGQHGWASDKVDAYDQHYYRTWMHELPPLHHVFRHTVLDVHHTIAPPTARHRVEAAPLFAAARKLELRGNFYVLGPTDMVLHSITHLVQEGEFEHGLRDLMDVGDLLGHFGREPAFWPDLLARAERHGLGRPLYYAAHQARNFLGTEFPPDFAAAIERFRPDGLTRRVMAAVLSAGLAGEERHGAGGFARFCRWLLYVRGHYLRMPLRLLIPHLVRKSFRRGAEA